MVTIQLVVCRMTGPLPGLSEECDGADANDQILDPGSTATPQMETRQHGMTDPLQLTPNSFPCQIELPQEI